jgi:hypothetical protein
MAKRKAARAKGRKTAGTRAGASRARTRAAGSARKKGAARTSATRRTRATGRKSASLRKASARQAARKVARKATRKATVRKTVRRRSAQATARKSPARDIRSGKSGGRPTAAKTSARKVPALDRERRIVRDDDLVPTPPSSLDLDRSASSARTGRRELVEKLHQHTEASPALTGGDVDADWASAYAVGDEAPGGDNPTPDQDIVDDIGKALGVQYEDNEELKGEKKISDRDKKRWELDPASSEDYDDR